MNDLPQTFMEPLLFKTACSRGTQARMSTEYLSAMCRTPTASRPPAATG